MSERMLSVPRRSRLAPAVLTALLAASCEPTQRPWRDAPDDASTPATIDVTTGGSDVPRRPSRDGAPTVTSTSWIDPSGPEASGCDQPGEAERLRAAWAVMHQHTVASPDALFRCLQQQSFSPATNGFAEEIVARIQSAIPTRMGCEVRPPSLVAHGQARLSDRALYASHDLLATRSAVRVADALVHAVLHEVNFEHHSGERGEFHYSVFSQVDRCLRQAAGDQDFSGLPRIQARDRMTIESELQPFGQMGGAQLPFYLLECPPGSWAVGHGIAHDASEPSAHVGGFGLICQTRDGVESARLSVRTPVRWASCGPDELVVGVQAVATNGHIFDATPLCEARSTLGRGTARPLSPLPPADTSDGYEIVRRCPPGQAVMALGGIAAGPDGVRQMAFICRDPTQVDIGTHRELPSLGLPPTGLGARIGLGRCSDQGVMVGFFGHVTPSTRDILRLGGVCRGTAWVGGQLGFRREGGAEVPEHVVAGTGGIPADQSPDAPSFSELATNQNDGRCPDGMGLVGVRAQSEPTDDSLRSLQGLCAPLDEWAHGRSTSLTPVTITGVWEAPSSPDIEERRCGPGEFLVGMRIERAPLIGGRVLTDRVERFSPICRNLQVVQ